MQKVKYYRCPACKKVYNSLKPWSNHMLTAHKELIPEGWSPARYFYYIQTDGLRYSRRPRHDICRSRYFQVP